MTTFKGFLEIDLDEAVSLFDCVSGVVYKETRTGHLYRPHYTSPNCVSVTCDRLDPSSFDILHTELVNTSALNQPMAELGRL